LLKTCEVGIWAHPSNNTQYDTTNAVSIHFPPMIPWSTSLGINSSRFRKSSFPPSNATDNMSKITRNLTSEHI
jgi:hypothetical protein